MNKVIGIDISKQTFDVSFREETKVVHKVYSNNEKGFKAFKLRMGHLKETRIVMEASGPYYVNLASYLHAHNIDVSVVNPLKIKRFGQMKFYRAKTDKKDSSMIMEYGESEFGSLANWKPEGQGVQALKQMRATVELLQKQLKAKQKSTGRL